MVVERFERVSIPLLAVLVITFGAIAAINSSPQVSDGDNLSSQEIVSKDPNLSAFQDLGSPEDGERVRWLATDEVGPWHIDGSAGITSLDAGNRVVLHPTGGNWRNSVDSAIRQTVELPSGEPLTAVLKARNPASEWRSTKSRCINSLVTLAVAKNDVGSTPVYNRTIVGDKPRKITMDVSRFAGETVQLAALADAAGKGCGRWNAEFTLISSLYIQTEEDTDL
ncbi:MAG: hypothetical protein SVY41_00410 [Candidatus Nanohaloarchaea archaeon]|nr:hypothetical protein [Candidatus Nanohaloarchaea archaeon]